MHFLSKYTEARSGYPPSIKASGIIDAAGGNTVTRIFTASSTAWKAGTRHNDGDVFTHSGERIASIIQTKSDDLSHSIDWCSNSVMNINLAGFEKVRNKGMIYNVS